MPGSRKGERPLKGMCDASLEAPRQEVTPGAFRRFRRNGMRRARTGSLPSRDAWFGTASPALGPHQGG